MPYAFPFIFELSILRLVHTDCGNGNGKNGLHGTLWVAIALVVGLHVNTSIRSNVTHSWWKKYLSFRCRCRSQCEQAITFPKNCMTGMKQKDKINLLTESWKNLKFGSIFTLVANIWSQCYFPSIMKADFATTVSPHTQDRLMSTVPIRLCRTPVTSDQLSRSPVPFLFTRCGVIWLGDSQMNKSIRWIFW